MMDISQWSRSEIPLHSGDRVNIDGTEFVVHEIEYSRVLMAPSFIYPCISLAVKPAVD